MAETKWPPFSRRHLSNVYSWMKIYRFWLKFHWTLFPMVQLTIFQHWFRWRIGAYQATSHYLNQRRHNSMMHIYVTRSQWVNSDSIESILWMINSSPPGQNGRHLADDIFKCIFLNENLLILIKISLKFIPNGPIYNIPTLVQIMAWRRPGDKSLSVPMVA